MSSYGQAIAPKWFKTTEARQVTKMQFAHLMHRALLQVGMQVIGPWQPFDLADPAQSDRDAGGVGHSEYAWYYDYPTTETFLHNGIAYRPCLCMYVPVDDTSGAPGTSTISSYVFFYSMYRRADRLIRDDTMNMIRAHASTVNFGLGNFNTASTPTGDLTHGSSTGLGAYYLFTTWKVHGASTSTSRTALLGLKNIHVILGKGGLTVQVGTGTGKQDSNDILSFTCVFGGARIPGRAKVPASDVNLNLINPIVHMPHAHAVLEAGTANYYTNSWVFSDVTLSGEAPASWVLGLQHDLDVVYGSQAGYTDRPGAVRAYLLNLENIERPFLPVMAAPTQESPRETVYGGAHILQPMVYWTGAYRGNLNVFYGPKNTDIRDSIVPSWEDAWYAPGFRFCDRIAPYGEYVDPATGTNWFLFRASGVNSMMGVEVEGITKYAALSAPGALTEIDDDFYTLANGAFSWSDPSPHDAAGVVTGVAWTFTPATDEATVTITSSNVTALTLTIEPYDNLVATDRFGLSLELYWRSVSAQVNSTSNPLHLEYSLDGATWITALTIYNTGVTAGAYQDYTAIPEIKLPIGDTDNRIRFRLRHVFTSTTGGNRLAGLRNIHLKRYTA